MLSDDLLFEDETQLAWVSPEVLTWVHQERMMRKKFGQSSSKPSEIDWYKADVYSFGTVMFEMLVGGEGPEQREKRMANQRARLGLASESDTSSSGTGESGTIGRKHPSGDSEMLELTPINGKRDFRRGQSTEPAWDMYGSSHSLDSPFLDMDALDQRENDFLMVWWC